MNLTHLKFFLIKKVHDNMKIDKDELVGSSGGWAPGKLEYKPLFVWPIKPLAFLKWLFHYPDGFIFPWAVVHFAITLIIGILNNIPILIASTPISSRITLNCSSTNSGFTS